MGRRKYGQGRVFKRPKRQLSEGPGPDGAAKTPAWLHASEPAEGGRYKVRLDALYILFGNRCRHWFQDQVQVRGFAVQEHRVRLVGNE